MDAEMAIFSPNDLSIKPEDATIVALPSHQNSPPIEDNSSPKPSAASEEVSISATEEATEDFQDFNRLIPIQPVDFLGSSPSLPESDVKPDLLLLESQNAAPSAQEPNMEPVFYDASWQRPSHYDQAHYQMPGPSCYDGNQSQMEYPGNGAPWQRDDAPHPMRLNHGMRPAMHPNIPWQHGNMMPMPMNPWPQPVCYGDMQPPLMMPPYMPYRAPRMPYRGGPYMPYNRPYRGPAPRYSQPSMRTMPYGSRGASGRRASQPRPERSRSPTIITMVDGREVTFNYNWPPPRNQEPRRYMTKKRKAQLLLEQSDANVSEEPKGEEERGADSVAKTVTLCQPLTSSVESPLGFTPTSFTQCEETPPARQEADVEFPQVQPISPPRLPSSSNAATTQALFKYKPRASKITREAAPSSSNIIQDALKNRASHTNTSAMTTFNKRMLTLYSWLYPNSTKKEVRDAVDGMWDTIPDAERAFYLAQAEGPFGPGPSEVMINPQLAGLPGLPEYLVRLVKAAKNNEDEEAVRHLLEITQSESWDEIAAATLGDYCYSDDVQSEEEVECPTQSDEDVYFEDVDQVESHPCVTLGDSPPHDDVNENDFLDLRMLAEIASQRRYLDSATSIEVIEGGDLELGSEVVVDGGGGGDSPSTFVDNELAVIVEMLRNEGQDDYATEWGFVTTQGESLLP